MHRFSILILGVALFCGNTCVSAEPNPCVFDNPDVVDTTPKGVIDAVFVGQDEDMPIDGCYMYVLKDSARQPYPGDILSAANLVVGSLPNWYVRESRRVGMDRFCNVKINDISVLNIYIYWFMNHWGYDDPESGFSKSMDSWGVELPQQNDEARDILGVAICMSITGSSYAEINNYVHDYASRELGLKPKH